MIPPGRYVRGMDDLGPCYLEIIYNGQGGGVMVENKICQIHVFPSTQLFSWYNYIILNLLFTQMLVCEFIDLMIFIND